MAPGKTLTIPEISKNSAWFSQLWFITHSLSIKGKNEYAPPTANKPDLKKSAGKPPFSPFTFILPQTKYYY
jgi:hypothetical protein